MKIMVLRIAICLCLGFTAGHLHAADVFHDDFESYPLIGFPTGWKSLLGEPNPTGEYIDDSQAASGGHSLRLGGVAVAYHAVPFPTTFKVKVQLRVDQIDNSGDATTSRAGLSLINPLRFFPEYHGTLGVHSDGQLYAGGTAIGPVILAEWNEIVLYVDLQQRVFYASINDGDVVGSFSIDWLGNPAVIGLTANNGDGGEVWFDDVVVEGWTNSYVLRDPFSQWVWRNPLPFGRGLNGVASGSGIFVAVGEGGSVATSPNGIQWNAQRSGSFNSLLGVIFTNEQFVAFGRAGTVLLSRDGTNWLHACAGSGDVYNVIFANGLYVAVGEGGGGGAIFTSYDAISWASQQVHANGRLRGVAYGAGIFVVVGAGGGPMRQMFTSPDGTNWTSRIPGDVFGFDKVVYAQGKFLAIGEKSGDRKSITSTDGITWNLSDTTAPTPHSLRYINGMFVAVDSMGVFTSPDGIGWTNRFTGTGSWLSDVTYGNGRFQAVGYHRFDEIPWFVSSTNGISWTEQTPGITRNLDKVIYEGGRLVAVGGISNPRISGLSYGTGHVMVSTNGVTWTNGSSGINQSLASVTYGGGRYVAIGGSGESDTTSIFASSNGTSWALQKTIVYPSLISSVVYGNNRFVAVGGNLVLWSKDGLAWSAATPTPAGYSSIYLSAVCFGQGKFVAIGTSYGGPGFGPEVLTSIDGKTWTHLPRPPVDSAWDIAYGNGVFTVLGEDDSGRSQMATSPDLMEWTVEYRLGAAQINFTGLRFFATGVNFVDIGLLWSSEDGIVWQQHYMPNALASIAYAHGSYVGVGRYGTILQTTPPLVSDVPVIMTQPQSLTIPEGENINLNVDTLGTAPLHFQWRFNEADIPGATNSSFMLVNAQASHSGNYSVFVHNLAGDTISSNAVVQIYHEVSLAEALDGPDLNWTTGGNDQWIVVTNVTHDGTDAARSGSITHNQSSWTEITVTGPGELTFWWKVSSESSYDFLRLHMQGALQQQISGEVSWTKVTRTIPSGTHALRWTYNKDNSVSSGADAGWLDQVAFVPDPPVAPIILTHPFSQTRAVGDNLSLCVEVQGSPLFYQWLKNGNPIDGATSECFTVSNVQAHHAGTYSLFVSNSVGTALSLNAVVAVFGPPAISTNPVSQSVYQGTVTTLTVVASGSPSPRYQWRKLGTSAWNNISGATNSSLILQNSTVGTNVYQVVVSNSHGTATSQSAKVTVLPCTYTLSESGVIISIDGGSNTVTVTAGGGCEWSVLITNNWINLLAAESGAGSGAFSYSVPPNNGFPRAGFLRIGNKSHFVAQAGYSSNKFDFSDDNLPDILLQRTNGAFTRWAMDGTNFLSNAALRNGTAAPGWRAFGVGDFNADGRADVVLQNNTTRRLATWLMDGTNFQSAVFLRNGIAPGIGWRAVGTADFNGDGKPDVLLQSSSRTCAVWLMNGTNFIQTVSLRAGVAAATGFRVVGAGDMTGDGQTDIVWQNVDGRVASWNFIGTTFVGSVWLRNGPAASTGWKIRGVADFDSNGDTDLLLQNVNGKTVMWLFTGTSFVRSIPFRNVPLGWSIVGPK